MNLDEAVELLKVVSAIPVKKHVKHPEIRIVPALGEVIAKGYTVYVEKRPVAADYLKKLNEIVEFNKLAIRESKSYLIIYRNSV